MKLFNLEDRAQDGIQSESFNNKKNDNDSTATFDKSSFGQQWDIKPKKKKSLFEVGELQ